MMRIAHIIHGWPPESMGGTGLYVAALAAAQTEAGHTSAILAPTPGRPTEQHGTQNHVEHWTIETDRVRQWTDIWNGTTHSWRAWCADWRPDVVHVHHLSGWSLSLIEDTPCRTILTLHDYAIPCARGQLVREDLSLCDGPTPAGCTACLGPALRTHPALTKMGEMLRPFPRLTKLGHSFLRRGSAEIDPRVSERLKTTKAVFEAADVVLSPSDDLIQRMVSLGYPRPEKTALPLLRPPKPSPPPTAGPVRFLFASSIIPTKGPQQLIKAFLKINQDATLTIAGHAPRFDGHPDFASNLQAATQAHPQVHWIGAVPPEQIPDLMVDHDVLVLPSIWPENSPLVVREATAAGLHIIARDIGGTRELAPNCTLFHDDDELQTALKKATQLGRMRHPPAIWPTPSEHAQTLLNGPYLQERA